MRKITRSLATVIGTALMMSSVANARPVTPGAVEQIEDIAVHTVTGTANNGVALKLGAGFDGGDGVSLLKWDVTGFASPLASVIGDFARINSGDGSFAIHQMVTAWDESTDFGTTLPVAGVDYRSAPVGVIGFNDGKSNDQVDLSKLFQYWQANPGNNHGLILVPRGQLNGAYPNAGGTAATGTFGNELQMAAHTRVAGVDGDDNWVVPTGGAVTQQTLVLEPMEETGIIENLAHSLLFSTFSTVGMYASPGNRQMPLMKFGLGELMFDGEVGAIADAQFEIHVSDGNKPEVTFGVHKMLTNWDEATATWAQFGGSGPVAGVDYETVAAATGTIGGGAGSDTVDLTSLVNEWLADPSTDYGVILVPITQADLSDNLGVVGSERILGALDSDDTRLIVTLVPEPASIALMGLGGALILMRRRIS